MEFLFNQNVQFYLLAYALGGIPFGLILAKIFAGVNVKESGSGSIGATNVLRVVKETNPSLAKKLGAATLALDALKGIAIVLAAKYVGMSDSVVWLVAVLAVIGHCFSPYLWFEGGKGVATGMG
ncbi:MAG: glycerol-3-phosphate acyltransferase, partial [Sulfuricurvum sp.]|nr:glycerol-3-phosphate acyltransferase [Sulfuricurvum sp.]